MKLQELFDYLKENLYTTVADALKVKHFLIKENDDLLVQIPYSSGFVSRFYQYLQLRILISHGNLIPNLNINSILENAVSFTPASVNLPAKNLCDILKQSIELKDNSLLLGLRYLANDGNAAWELSLDNNILTIRDWINGKDDGSVLENYFAGYDDLSPWQENILKEFGGYMESNHICLDITIDAPDDFIKGIIKYLYMTVLIANGHRYIK